MMNGVEYLQKKLREKEKIISELKMNTNININEFDVEKSYVSKIQEKEASHQEVVEKYEKKIAELTEEVRNMKEAVKNQVKQSPEQEQVQKGYVAQL